MNIKHSDMVRVNPTCSCCGKRIKPIFKPTPNPQDWTYRDCETCFEDVCLACSIEHEDGRIECVDCYQAEAIRRIK